MHPFPALSNFPSPTTRLSHFNTSALSNAESSTRPTAQINAFPRSKPPSMLTSPILTRVNGRLSPHSACPAASHRRAAAPVHNSPTPRDSSCRKQRRRRREMNSRSTMKMDHRRLRPSRAPQRSLKVRYNRVGKSRRSRITTIRT